MSGTELEDGYFGVSERREGRPLVGEFNYDSAPERGGEVPTQDLVEVGILLHIQRSVTREYTHRMYIAVDLLNQGKIALSQLNLRTGEVDMLEQRVTDNYYLNNVVRSRE
ncbi:hypothetical protein HY636_01790 [Candidatus Woesearchaeota archaeon]|nr:hypothetical protein [Candidatus Woesearchaeota archaeon]